jgi:pilus assembly protein CpaB
VSIRSVLVVLLALVFGACAAVGVSMLRNPPPPEAPPAPVVETVPVVVALVDIPRFTTLTPDMLKTRDFPKDAVPAGTANRVEDVTDRVALSGLVKDEPIIEGKLAVRGTGRGMAPGLPIGMRAFTILVPTQSSGVAGFILPGNKVDVLLTMSGNGGPADLTGGASTFTLLQSIEILAVDQQVDAPSGNKVDVNAMRSVTLLVTPEQAEWLDLAQNKGILHLSLKHPDDTKQVKFKPVTLADLGLVPQLPKAKEAEAAPQPTADPPPPAKIRTIRGNMAGIILLD